MQHRMVVRRSPPSGSPVLSWFAVVSYHIVGAMAMMLFYGRDGDNESCGGAFDKIDGAKFG